MIDPIYERFTRCTRLLVISDSVEAIDRLLDHPVSEYHRFKLEHMRGLLKPLSERFPGSIRPANLPAKEALTLGVCIGEVVALCLRHGEAIPQIEPEGGVQ